MSVALVSAATATATALTVGVEPPRERAHPLIGDDVDLAAAVQLLPDSGQYPNPKNYPDLTGGLGSSVYDASQAFADQLIRAIVNGISLTALAEAAGVDPQTVVTTVLTNIPPELVGDILGSIKLDVPIVDEVLGALTDDQIGLLSGILDLVGVPEVTDGTLTGLLALLGLDLSNPLDLSNLDVPGINLVTAGPTFTVLKMLGVDLGWVPALPNSVADEINGSPYLEVGLAGVLNLVKDQLDGAIAGGLLADDGPLGPLLGELLGGAVGDLLGDLELPATLDGLVQGLDDLIALADPITGSLPDLVHARITPAVGIGLGAFAVAMAYQQVVEDLPNQPGGSNYEALTGRPNPILGSLTVLPMILINNPARPDGGAAARFAPLAALFGIDTVNPHTQLTGENGVPLGNTGLHLGGANVLPILVDVGYEYQPMGDLAAWPNPVTLTNNLAAALFPTYMLRGLQLDGLSEQLGPQLGKVVSDALEGKPLAVNLYLTLDSATLPMLEPLYLAADVLNLVGLSPLAQLPMRVANALAPALTTMTNLGYANAYRNQDGTYDRDFSTAGDETPFMSFPDVDWGKVPGDVIGQLFGGIQKEFLSGSPTTTTPNALASLLGLVSGGGLPGLQATITQQVADQTADAVDVASVPSSDARMMSLAAADDSGDGQQSDRSDESKKSEQAEQQPESQQQADEPTATETATETEPDAPKAPRHAKPDTDDADAQAPAPAPTSTVKKRPRHAKPEFNVVRDIANHFAPKPADKPASTAGDDASQPTTPAEPAADAGSGSPDSGAAA